MQYGRRMRWLELHSKGATIITSQLPIKKWYECVNDSTLAYAIMDRLSGRVNKIDLKGESLND
ncbi:MAG: ATP-binding protein [Bacteroidetes bacterium]|nr:ATP-binding protein [Bacteroidota bacterium]